MKQLSVFLILLGLCFGTGAFASTEEKPANTKAPFASDEDFDFAGDDGGLISFAEAPSFVGMIARPFGETESVRAVRLYELKEEKALKADRQMCLRHVLSLHGMESAETENEQVIDLELFKSRFGQACEVRIAVKGAQTEFREYSYTLTVIKAKVYVLAYKSRTKITHKESADFRKFVKSLK